MKVSKHILSIAGIGLILSHTVLLASGDSATTLLKRANHYIGTLNAYTFNAVVTEEEGGEGKSYKQYVSVKVKRPNDLRVDTKGAFKNRSTYLHDGHFTMVDHDFDYYGQLTLPKKSIDAALDYIFNRYGIKAPLAALIYSDMNKRSKFTKSTYFGKRTVGGVVCDYIALRNRGGEVHIWISSGEKPLVQAFTIIDTTIKEKPRTTASIKWNTTPVLSDEIFTFSKSNGISKISIENRN